MPDTSSTHSDIPRFDRHFFDGQARCTRIGSGAVGGKASGLIRISDVLAERLDARAFPAFDVAVPRLSVVGTDMFDAFMARNDLWPVVRSDRPDDRIALAFQQASLPVELLGDLRALVEQVHSPLAVRSSSLLEDALLHPFAGVYATKMTPNNQPDADTRFRKLAEAIKYVYASTFFGEARSYVRAMDHAPDEEKMAVVIQEVVGRRHGDRFYPDVSGVGRSYNYYRSGAARPEDGVVNLALGLGKTIVDGGICWTYSPRMPRATPPFGSVREQLKQSQVEFWAVNMGRPPAYDPTVETEYLARCPLAEADYDGTLRCVASTYLAESDRLAIGVGMPGPRVVNFAPLLVLEEYPLNDLLRRLLGICRDAIGEAVEIEFALTITKGAEPPVRFGFLQVRPMVVSHEVVDVDLGRRDDPAVLASSDRVMGNGVVSSISDIVYVKPEGFEARFTPDIADELAVINRTLAAEHRPYLLIGFGRWGSSDPWLGIPVSWGHIGGARAIVEATLPVMDVELSQGSHFFHNISSFGVSYFSVPHASDFRIDWSGLGAQDAIAETRHVRHVRTRAPLEVRVDGRQGAGVILWGRA
jgi:hypothetical protein